MPQKTPTSTASYIYRLAKEHNVEASRDNTSYMAATITALSGDAVELDSIEQLLVNLKRRGILTKAEILQLQGCYLREQRDSRKK
ncbi:hypothetical protein [Klebsiella michiganensis]|uniref:hypothetical protein n=1 Tax=Klebsiella michiganensis TaxID=1134687 RepID=UPI00164F4064|nr:hypothetical protein [Klebsiella michiganensis]HBM2944831.1 hypothetical protein [Klebsiella michiganensis]